MLVRLIQSAHYLNNISRKGLLLEAREHAQICQGPMLQVWAVAT